MLVFAGCIVAWFKPYGEAWTKLVSTHSSTFESHHLEVLEFCVHVLLDLSA
jgi:hypothetical protein